MLRIALLLSFLSSSVIAQDDAGQRGDPAPEYKGRVVPFSYRSAKDTVTHIFCGWYVKPDLFVTCKHNVKHEVGESVQLENGGTAKLKYKTSDLDGFAVWQVSPPVSAGIILRPSSSDPVKGQVVYHIGLPDGDVPVYVKGKIAGESYLYEDKSEDSEKVLSVISQANYCRGYSGGPVIDERGYVVAINTNSNKEENIAVTIPISRLNAVLTSFQSETYSNRPYIDVWVSGDFYCAPCESFLDYARTTSASRGFDYHVRKLTRAQCAAKGLSVPLFTIGDEPYTGKYEWPLVDEWAREKLGIKDSQQLPVKSPPEQATPPVPQQATSQATPDLPPGVTASPEALMILAQALDPDKKKPAVEQPVADWSGLKIIIAVSDSIPGVARVANGPGKRAIERLTSGKAEVFVITESERPGKFSEYESTLGVNVEQFHVAILIPELRDSSDFIINQVELMLNANISSSITEKIRDIPVEPLFKSISPTDYDAALSVIKDLGPVESVPVFELTDPKVFGPIAGLIAIVYAGYMRKKKKTPEVSSASEPEPAEEKVVAKKKIATRKKATTK
tara:strand:+ start:16009 stop:17697 length:1689 start_codon:yes stop_codon:yes gene_type:complete